MTRPLLVLRPQPAADATATKATALGFRAIVAPLFRIVPRAWENPAEPFDAVLVTSANAAHALAGRIDGAAPVYAVGRTTADAVRDFGFDNVVQGSDGVAEIVRCAADDGVRTILHLAGEDRTDFDPAGVRIDTRIVYAAEPVDPPLAFSEALAEGAVALLHSVRAAGRFRELAGIGHRIAAISPAVLGAAGDGWAATAVAARSNDDALLAVATRLCQ